MIEGHNIWKQGCHQRHFPGIMEMPDLNCLTYPPSQSEIVTILVPTSQIGKQRQREVDEPSQGHIAVQGHKWLRQYTANPSLPFPSGKDWVSSFSPPGHCLPVLFPPGTSQPSPSPAGSTLPHHPHTYSSPFTESQASGTFFSSLPGCGHHPCSKLRKMALIN